jgi:hypothetical protein
MTNKIASLKLTDRFIKGLKKYDLTVDEIQNNNWKYCGGNIGRHYNYFKICCKDDELPMKTNDCICGHHIIENCYITDGKIKLVLGNCCIKKFIPKSGRTCAKCDKPHKNRTVDRCNDCRIGICDECDKNCDKTYKKCYSCNFKKKKYLI